MACSGARSDRRKNGEQAVEDHAGRHCKQAVLSDLLVGAPEDILPALPRYLPRHFSMAASARLICAFAVNDARFAAAADADSLISQTPPKLAVHAISSNDLARQHQPDKDA